MSDDERIVKDLQNQLYILAGTLCNVRDEVTKMKLQISSLTAELRYYRDEADRLSQVVKDTLDGSIAYRDLMDYLGIKEDDHE